VPSGRHLLSGSYPPGQDVSPGQDQTEPDPPSGQDQTEQSPSPGDDPTGLARPLSDRPSDAPSTVAGPPTDRRQISRPVPLDRATRAAMIKRNGPVQTTAPRSQRYSRDGPVFGLTPLPVPPLHFERVTDVNCYRSSSGRTTASSPAVGRTWADRGAR
jgi:hypothetical protein